MSYHIIKIIVIVSLLLMQNGCNKPSEPIDNPHEKDTIPNYDEGCTSGITNPSVKGKILFTSRRTGEYQQLFMMDPDGSNIKQLTFGNYSSLMGRWSKDGKMIVFQSDTPKTTLGIPVYVMNSNGGNKHPLLPNFHFNRYPMVGTAWDWSPYDKEVSVNSCKSCDPYPIYKMYIINVDNGNYSIISDSLKVNGISTVWSPDGSKIAFNSVAIYIAKSDLSNLRKINIKAGSTGIAWSPDGCKIVYAKTTETNTYSELFIYNLEMNTCQQITTHTTSENYLEPRWSPDSKKVIFYSESIPSIENGFSRNTYIKVVDIYSKQITTVIDDSTATYPDWSWSEINE